MANTYNTKNYFAHGGEQLVIGGKLTFLEGAEVENFPGSTSGNAASGTAPYVADSEATTVAVLKATSTPCWPRCAPPEFCPQPRLPRRSLKPPNPIRLPKELRAVVPDDRYRR